MSDVMSKKMLSAPLLPPGKKYWCYYSHRSRDLVSPETKILTAQKNQLLECLPNVDSFHFLLLSSFHM